MICHRYTPVVEILIPQLMKKALLKRGVFMLCQKNLDHVDSGVIHVEDSRGLNWSKDAESIIMVTQDNTEQKFISETMKRMEELHISYNFV